ncbi:glutathione peroxidase [Paucibacter sp. B51]|uniref:glutathione peroxidase n=1 Tax=Paucibacter sp. B51 TaxID=2993315 RepID=UPI0022EBA6EA|nr:glutathione peroxidase [Paucibacter sp. B51]
MDNISRSHRAIARPAPAHRAAALSCGALATALALAAWVSPVRAAPAAAPAASASASCPELLQREFPRLQDEKPQALCQYAGKVVLVVNTASFCGFTSQYKSLETLSSRYAPRGLVVLGFPSNDFGGQEPGSNKEIAEFCENTFNVKFPMFAKSVVKAGQSGLNPLYADLGKRTGQTPKWNFHKYLVSRDGSEIKSFGSMTDPLGQTFTQELERLLAKP